MPPDAAVCDHADTGIANRQAALDERLHLRNAEAGVGPRCAAAARADADLDAVRTEIDEEPRPVGGPYVAGNHLEVTEALAELLHRTLHDDRVPVGDVNDKHVDPGLDQFRRALEVIAGRADCCADHEPSMGIARRERQLALPADVSRRHQTQAGVRRHRRAAAS